MLSSASRATSLIVFCNAALILLGLPPWPLLSFLVTSAVRLSVEGIAIMMCGRPSKLIGEGVVGEAEGDKVGYPLGTTEGWTLGWLLGSTDVSKEGFEDVEGCNEGWDVGTSEGSPDGTKVGWADGCNEGHPVGEEDTDGSVVDPALGWLLG